MNKQVVNFPPHRVRIMCQAMERLTDEERKGFVNSLIHEKDKRYLSDVMLEQGTPCSLYDHQGYARLLGEILSTREKFENLSNGSQDAILCVFLYDHVDDYWSFEPPIDITEIERQE